MKHLILTLLVLVLCATPCDAQFRGAFGKIYKVAKAVAGQSPKLEEESGDDLGNKKIKDILNEAAMEVTPEDTTSEEYKKKLAQIQQEMFASNPQLKKIMELQGDTVALKKYMLEQYGGLTEDEIAKKAMGAAYDSQEYQKASGAVKRMTGFDKDPVFKKAKSEKRQFTMEEARYLNGKYGTSFEYEGMEAYNDSIGVFAHVDGKIKPMAITVYEQITDQRPIPDFGQDEIKQYVKNGVSFLKKPFADREIVDSVQNYLIYNHRHADEQFLGSASFTLYSNLETDITEKTVKETLLRKMGEFATPLAPSNIFVFKVHKGLGCRFMEYMYTKISYMQSELTDYVMQSLIDAGCIDASVNKKMSDEEFFKAMDKAECQFKLSKLSQKFLNNEKFLYANCIPAAKNVKITSNTRMVGGHVTALDLNIEAEPGEYAFVIRYPEVDKYFKGLDVDISLLSRGAFFFTIK